MKLAVKLYKALLQHRPLHIGNRRNVEIKEDFKVLHMQGQVVHAIALVTV